MASFDFQRAFTRIRAAVRPYPPAALFQLYDDGFTTPFQQLLIHIPLAPVAEYISPLC